MHCLELTVVFSFTIFLFPLFQSVVFLENEIMYGRSFEVDDKVMDSDFVLPIGKAKIEKEGKFCFCIKKV